MRIPTRPRRFKSRRFAAATPMLAALLGLCVSGCATARPTRPPLVTKACADTIQPTVRKVTERVFVATGFDITNTILIRSAEGNVIVDPGMSRARAERTREALQAAAPGPIRAVIYTHSHIDHVGAAAAWVTAGTEIWASTAFIDHFFKQYALFQPAERRRGGAQFGEHVSDDLVCSALGIRPDFEGSLRSGARLPNHVFRDRVSLRFGDVELVLVEAPGETHDQLFVWLPQEKILLPGDNYYHSFPNLYTIRGTSPRPVDQWIRSLDQMRALQPEWLIPSHTAPFQGRERILQALTDYRDAIQWVRDETVRGANAGTSLDELAHRVRLPEHLRDQPYLFAGYGQVDWSVRGIYTSNLGWFDERPGTLYPISPNEVAQRELAFMGGLDRVLEAAQTAHTNHDYRWEIHLLEKVLRAQGPTKTLRERLASAYEAMAYQVSNTNGRAYLLETAWSLRQGSVELAQGVPDDALLDSLPLDMFFSVLPTRLDPRGLEQTHESLVVHFTDESDPYVITIRRGVAEVWRGSPLPGTPEPVAVLVTNAPTWKRLALQQESPLAALTSGRLKINGSTLAAARFLARFKP